MKKYYITFGGQAYDIITQSAIVTARRYGADEVLVYDDSWLIQQDFYKMNKWLWHNHPDKRGLQRGFGWWCWKPYIIWRTLEKCNEGDVVLFADGDSIPIENLNPLYEICHKDGGIMLFASEGHRQIEWCKADTYIVMGQMKNLADKQSRAGVARFMLFEKGPWKSTQFLMEWMTYCINPMATTFDSSVLIEKEEPEFKEARAEQAIMTNLAHKYNLELYREADEGAGSSTRNFDLYKQVFTQNNPNCCGNKTQDVGNGSVFRNIDKFFENKTTTK